MDLRSNRQSAAQYTPTEDVTQELEDGRIIQIAVAGVPMSMAAAIAAGLVDEQGQPVAKAKAAKPAPVGPSELKEGEEPVKPSEKK